MHLEFNYRKPFKTKGFSLVELLASIALVAILAAFIVPAMNTVLKGSQLTQGAQMLNDQLGYARQRALSRNRSVEVRFYQYRDPEIPSEKTGAGKYRSVQIFEIQESGAAVALSKTQPLPNSIVIDSGSTLSTLLKSSQDKTWTADIDPQVSLPRIGVDYKCSAFRFLPDGSTNLSPSSLWYLTLHSINEGDALATPPQNFFNIQIEPHNGQIRTFRP